MEPTPANNTADRLIALGMAGAALLILRGSIASQLESFGDAILGTFNKGE